MNEVETKKLEFAMSAKLSHVQIMGWRDITSNAGEL